jgi:protein TonB
MPIVSAAATERRRNIVGFLTSTLCHTLLFGVGALVLTRPMGRPAAAQNVEVALIEAKPDPIRDLAPMPPDKQPAPTVPVTPRTSVARPRPKPQARVQNTTPQLTVSPSTEVAMASDVALPAALEPPQRTDEIVPATGIPSAPPAPAPSRPKPIPVITTPHYRSSPHPEYPIASRRRHEEGEVRLTVAVSPDGRPLHVSLLKSSGYPLLDQAAIDAVRECIIEPARVSGVAVTSQAVVPVRFSLSQD